MLPKYGSGRLLDAFDRSIPAKSISFRRKKPNTASGLKYLRIEYESLASTLYTSNIPVR